MEGVILVLQVIMVDEVVHEMKFFIMETTL